MLSQNVAATAPLVEIMLSGTANNQNCENKCVISQTVTVQKGSAVEWINNDLIPHTLASGKPEDKYNGTLFNSGQISVGKFFIRNFNDVGVYYYFEKDHPENTGIINVTEVTYSQSITGVTPLQTHDDNGNKLTIHNETGIDVTGKFLPPPTTPPEPPLKQFHSGIKPEYVKCSQNLHLIIKAEDGSFACVTIETGKNLAERGWATTFGTGISTNDYYTKCDTLYPQSDTGIAVLYMPVNSVGKICVRYYNLNNTPTGIGMRIFEANNLTQNASDVTAWTDNSTLEGNANKTIVYFIKTGTKAGFYGASLNCGGIPFAVGYNANSTITASDFPWVGQIFHCGAITYDSHIEGTTGIGVKYIPYP